MFSWISNRFDLLLLDTPSGFTGVLFLLQSLQFANLKLKVEAAKRLLTTVFTQPNAPGIISQQFGWQNTLTKLFVKRSIAPNAEQSGFSKANDFISFEQDEAAACIDQVDMDAVEVTELQGFGIDPQTLLYPDNLSLQSVSTISEELSRAAPLIIVPSLENEETDVQGPSGHLSVIEDSQSMSVSEEEQLVYLLTNIIFTILWRGVGFYEAETWKEGEQIVTAINLLALNNELYCSHLILRMKLLEMTVQALLIDLGEVNNAKQTLNHQHSCAQMLRMIYDLVVLDKNDDNMKKCSSKLMDGVIPLLDSLMIFADAPNDDWVEMKRVCLGLLIQCASSTDFEIVAMSTAKLHCIFQSNHIKDVEEMGFLIYKLNQSINSALEGEKFIIKMGIPGG